LKRAAEKTTGRHNTGRTPALAETVFQGALSVFVLLAAIVGALSMTGCSGESGPTLIYQFPYPTDLRISGLVNLSDVAVSQNLGGITPSMVDLRPFSLYVEDDPLKKAASADEKGAFVLEPVSIRDQIVIFCRHATYKGLVLEWMAADSNGLFGEVRAEINLRSTAQSMIARSVRERYGRRINPTALTAEHLKPTVDAIADVLEKFPDKIAAVALDQVPEVKAAYTAMADLIHQGASGVYPNNLVLLFYMAGDNNLASYLARTMEDIAEAGLPSGTRIILQADFPHEGMKRFMLSDNKFVELGAIGKVDSASPVYMADLVAWSRRTFPAQKYALIISSHADGWRSPGQMRSSLLSDDDAGSLGNPIEIAAWLKGANTIFDGFYRPLDLLVFDACSMGNIETLFEFKDCALFSVASQGNVPAAGMPLGQIIRKIASTGVTKIDAKLLGEIFCDEYNARYIGGAVRLPVTVSLINNKGFATFIPLWQQYLNAILAHKELHAPVIASLRDKTEYDNEELPIKFVVQSFARSETRDLIDFIQKARNLLPAAKIQTDLLLPAFSSLIVKNYRAASEYPAANGISIAIPDKKTFNTEYAGLSPSHYFILQFSQQTLWDELLAVINSIP